PEPPATAPGGLRPELPLRRPRSRGGPVPRGPHHRALSRPGHGGGAGGRRLRDAGPSVYDGPTRSRAGSRSGAPAPSAAGEGVAGPAGRAFAAGGLSVRLPLSPRRRALPFGAAAPRGDAGRLAGGVPPLGRAPPSSTRPRGVGVHVSEGIPF